MINEEQWKTAYEDLLHQGSNDANDAGFWLRSVRFADSRQRDGFTEVSLATPNASYANYLDKTHRSLVEETLERVTGVRCKVTFEANPEGASINKLLNLSPLAPPTVFNIGRAEIPEPAPFPRSGSQSPTGTTHSGNYGTQQGNSASAPFSIPARDNVDPNLTFSRYIVGPSNQYAHASAYGAAQKPGHQFNPLFIYGPPAVGKTHLLHAIANQVRSKNPNARICLTSAEKFVNEFITHVQHKSIDLFRQRYRNKIDLLLIDDVQFILGKDRSEEEFFHTFNALHEDKKMIVLTSDKAPKEIDQLEERLRTRFEMGMVVDIRPPEIETRIAILRAKAEADDIYLPDEVALFLGKHVRDTVRNLHGVLVQLQQHASLTGSEISLDLARQLIQNQVPEEGEDFTTDMIMNAVCAHYKLKAKEIRGTSKARMYAQPRQIAMYMMRQYTSLGVREIASFFQKDHSTVVHSCKKIEIDIDSDPELKAAVEAIKMQL